MTAPVDDTMDWWLRLRHGGQLLDRTRLDALPEAKPLPWNLPEKLRSAIIALPDEGEGAPTGDELTALMDLLLEDVTGLRPGWLKGAKVGAGSVVLDAVPPVCASVAADNSSVLIWTAVRYGLVAAIASAMDPT